MNLSRSSSKTSYDVVIVGGGHNGLTCACYLAKAGLSVGVFERRPVLGGAAVTEEFHPGFRNSTASYTVSLLNPKVIRDLRLEEHGLKVLERPMQNFLPMPDGRALTAGPDSARTHASVKSFSARDAEKLPAYYQMLDAAVELLRAQLLETPPADPRRLRDLWSTIKLGRHMRKLTAPVQRDIHELFTRSAGDLLDHWFETDAVKALYGFDAVVGNYASPYTPGSAYVLLHHVFGEVNGKSGVWGHAVGGMGAITQAMATEARRLGVTLETEAPAKRIVVENQRANAVELEDGRVIQARAVASNIGPKPLYLKLLADAPLARGAARAHRAAARGLGHVPHERRSLGIAEVHRGATRRRRGTPGVGHHFRTHARIHGSRLRHGAARGHLSEAHRGNADSIDARSDTGAEGRSRGLPLLSAFLLQPAGRPRLASGEAECNRPHLRDSGFLCAQLPRERRGSFGAQPARSRRETGPRGRRHLPRLVRSRSAVGGASDVRLRRLPSRRSKACICAGPARIPAAA